jgi:hypothetical protein
LRIICQNAFYKRKRRESNLKICEKNRFFDPKALFEMLKSAFKKSKKRFFFNFAPLFVVADMFDQSPR